MFPEGERRSAEYERSTSRTARLSTRLTKTTPTSLVATRPYVEEMYENYLANPGSVPDNWRDYFDALQHVPARRRLDAKDVPHLPVINAFAERAKAGRHQGRLASADAEMGRKRTAVQQLIAAYRNVGAALGRPGPLKRTERADIPDLDPAFYGFTDADQETVFDTSNTFFGKDSMTPARAHERAARNLLRHHRCRVHVHHRPGRRSAGGSKSSRASAASPTSSGREEAASWNA